MGKELFMVEIEDRSGKLKEKIAEMKERTGMMKRSLLAVAIQRGLEAITADLAKKAGRA